MAENYEPYESPQIRTLGTVEELTEAGFDKVGSVTDKYSELTSLDGDIIPDP